MNTEKLETAAEVKPEKPRRPRGTGRLYQPKGNSRWYVQYYRDGKCIREATGTTNKTDARKLLEKRLAQIKTHTYVEPKVERTLVRDLIDGLRIEYQNQDCKSWADVEARWRLHLEPVFGNFRAVNVRTKDLKDYQNARKQEGASNGTINRELAALKTMFRIGLEDEKVIRMPKFPKELDEDASVRKGFLEDDQYSKLATATAKRGLWLRSMFEVGYRFGWRVGELLNLRVKQVDLAERTIRLEVGETKNGEAREANMPQLMYWLIQQCVSGKQPDDFVFTRVKEEQVKDFRGAWSAATTEARVPDLLFHDLRRTAARNLVRSGVSERVAMEITGHLTRNVFDRYNITAARDKKLAAQRMDEQQQKAAPGEFEHCLSIISVSGAIANAARPN
jgi:integrase